MQDQAETVAPSVAQHAMSDHITALKSLIEWCEQKAAGTAHMPGWGSAFLRDLENMRERESRRLVRLPMRGGPYDGKFLLIDYHGCSGSVDMPGGTYYYVAQGDGVWVWSGLIGLHDSIRCQHKI